MNPAYDLFAGFLAWLGQSSLQACLLIGLILALQAAVRDRISPRWRYALWLILVAKLVLPWAPASPLSVYNLLSFATHAVPANAADETDARPEAIAVTPPAPADAAAPEGPVRATAEPAQTRRTPTVAPSQGPSQGMHVGAWAALLRTLPVIWLAGAIALALFTVGQALRLAHIRRERFVTDQATLDLLEDCKQQMGVPAYLAVVETPRAMGPALFGFVRPRLLLPPGSIASLGPQRLRHVFLHELAHLKRHDITVNWVLAILQILHWFNPLVWYAFARMRDERELACDALALSHRGAPDPRDYGRTIVDMLETFVQPSRQPSLAGVLEDKSPLKRRITMIAQFRTSSRNWSLPAMALLVLLAGVALTNAQAGRPAMTGPGPEVSIADRDLRVEPYPEGGLFTASVTIRNRTDKQIAPFEGRFYRGELRDDSKPIHGAVCTVGPVEPNGTFCEATLPFGLPEGQTQFHVLLGPAGTPPSSIPPAHRADVLVTVKDGRIVETRYSSEADGGMSSVVTSIVVRPASHPVGTPRTQAFVTSTPNDSLLNDQQRSYVQGVERSDRDLDLSELTDLPAESRAQLEARWLQALDHPDDPAYLRAINGLAALRCRKAVPSLLRIATDRQTKPNRDRWMAARGLGLIGDSSAVPPLIPLLYHYNKDARMWAQVSLVRLTGQNFGDDWQAWTQWWNQQPGQPAASLEKVDWPEMPAGGGAGR